MHSLQTTSLRNRRDRKGNGRLRFTAVTLHDKGGQEISSPLCGEAVRVRFHYESELEGQRDVDMAFNMRNDMGVVLTAFANIQSGQPRLAVHRRGCFECLWPQTNLRGGDYDCALFCAVDGDICDWMQSAFTIVIEDGDFYRTGTLVSRSHGDVLCEHQWSSVTEDSNV
jgi:lipopolysaccharide transport system ATP-binding protein